MLIKKILKFLIFSAVAVSLFSGCTGSQTNLKTSSVSVAKIADNDKFSSEIFAMDTVMDITAYGKDSEKAVLETEKEIYRLEKLFSTTDENSEIYKLNKDKSAVLSDDTFNLIKRSIDFYHKTGEILDISIYPVVREWGFTTGEYKVPDNTVLEELKKHIDSDKIAINESTKAVTLGDKDMLIDLGAVAKGYTSDKICTLMKNMGIKSAVVSLGGNVQTIGLKPDGSKWKIAVQNPFSDGGYAASLEISDCDVITSGAYERYFEQNGKTYHHIMDPKTAAPADTDLASATIISKDAALADAYSTTLFIMGKDKAVDFWRKNKSDFDIILIGNDSNIYVSKNIANDFNLLDKNFTLNIIE